MKSSAPSGERTGDDRGDGRSPVADMALPGREPVVALKEGAAGLGLERAPEGLDGSEVAMNRERDGLGGRAHQR